MSTAALTPRSFVETFLDGSDVLPIGAHVATRCPVCDASHSLRINAFGTANCGSCGADPEGLALALDVAPATIHAHLDAIAAATASAPEPATAIARASGADALTSRLLTRSQLATLPPPEPLIAGTINRRSLAFVA